MSEENKTHLNPCPKCGTAWLFYDRYDRLQYKANCNCGFAWKISRWKDTAKAAAEEYNKKVKVKK